MHDLSPQFYNNKKAVTQLKEGNITMEKTINLIDSF